jgi:hypothetical protein
VRCPVDLDRHDEDAHEFVPRRVGVSARLICDECNRYVHVDE